MSTRLPLAFLTLCRDEPYYNMGKLVIGWHKDKLMVPHSSVAVYQYTEGNDEENFWAVAFKKVPSGFF